MFARSLDVLEKARTTSGRAKLEGKKGAKNLLVFSPAFVADCLETLIEIGDEYQEIFEEFGGEKVQLVPSSNTHPLFVQGLKQLIQKELS